MSKIFNQADYVLARTAAAELSRSAGNEHIALIIQQSIVPLLIYFLAHISEQRRCVKVSSLFYFDSLCRETAQRCIVFGEGKDAALSEIMRLAMAKAHSLWKPSRDVDMYVPPGHITDALVAFLQEQS